MLDQVTKDGYDPATEGKIMKKTLIVGSCLALLVVGHVGLRIATAPTPGVTKDNFDRLWIGMSVTEAESLLGKANHRIYGHPYGLAFRSDGPSRSIWHGDKMAISLFHENDGIVYNGEIWGGLRKERWSKDLPSNNSVFDKLKRLLRL